NSLRRRTRLGVERAAHAHAPVEVAVDLPGGAVARYGDGELRLLARRDLLVDVQAVGGERVGVVAFVLELDGDLLARRHLHERGLEVVVVGLDVERGRRLRTDVLGAFVVDLAVEGDRLARLRAGGGDARVAQHQDDDGQRDPELAHGRSNRS